MSVRVFSSLDLPDRFEELLRRHARVDIATAWATGGAHLGALERVARRGDAAVRAIVGVWGNVSHPDALERLNELTAGELKIITTGNTRFHPKLYLFGSGEDEGPAWIGSANFTRPGFGDPGRWNDEIMLEVGPGDVSRELHAWFRARWGSYAGDRQRVAKEIDEYRKRREKNPPHPQVWTLVAGDSMSRARSRKAGGSRPDPPGEWPRRDLLNSVQRPETFSGFVRALKKCEQHLRAEHKRRRDRHAGAAGGFTIFGRGDDSYMSVIRRRRDLLLRDGEWPKSGSKSWTELVGQSGSWGLLGTVYGGQQPDLRAETGKVKGILRRIAKAPDDDFPDIAVKAIRDFRKILPNARHGTVTPLLALARPDRLITVNDPSIRALAALSGMTQERLKEPEGYGELLGEWLYDHVWYRDGETWGDLPATGRWRPRDIWDCRAALVDAFVYEPD